MTIFASACLICSFALPDANRGCAFESTKYNMAFFYIVIITETVVRMVAQFLLITNED